MSSNKEEDPRKSEENSDVLGDILSSHTNSTSGAFGTNGASVATASGGGDTSNTASAASLGNDVLVNHDDDDDTSVAKKLHAIEQLTELYGFPRQIAIQSMNAITAGNSLATTTAALNESSSLLERCCNYVLENNLACDSGGPIVPKSTCVHLQRNHQFLLKSNTIPIGVFQQTCQYTGGTNDDKKTSRLKSTGDDDNDDAKCNSTENWLCLHCGSVDCSRYFAGHGMQHWEETKASAKGEHEHTKDGHCIVVSLTDLSFWCHCCQCYLSTSDATSETGTILHEYAQTLEFMKFSASTTPSTITIVASNDASADTKVQHGKEANNPKEAGKN